jgi:PST family polysaccharide transporter
VLRSFARPLLGGLAMGLVAWGVHRALGGGLVGLTAAGLASCAAYVPFVLPIVKRLRAGEPAAAGSTAERELAVSEST